MKWKKLWHCQTCGAKMASGEFLDCRTSDHPGRIGCMEWFDQEWSRYRMVEAAMKRLDEMILPAEPDLRPFIDELTEELRNAAEPRRWKFRDFEVVGQELCEVFREE